MPNDQKSYLNFTGLNAPVLLSGCDELLPLIRQMLPDWEFSQTAENAVPFMTITGAGDGRYLCKIASDTSAPKKWDAINSVCEMIAEFAWEQIRSDPNQLCLHCAAVEFNGRLVLFPNGRRAGKSTLSAVLAERGRTLFTDDFLMIDAGDHGVKYGSANGVLPRIRLPIPADFSNKVGNWVTQNPGPANSQYKYLEIESLAARGTRFPIGGIVFLERDDDAITAIEPMGKADALEGLIRQNFARSVHAGAILKSIKSVADEVDTYKLHYSHAEAAADLLEAKLGNWSDEPVAQDSPGRMTPQANLALLDQQRSDFEPEATYMRAEALTEVVVEGQIYLADGSGLGVHRLNEGSIAIWRLLAEPSNLSEVCAILEAAFPDVDPAQIADDSRRTLENFVQNRLVSRMIDEERKSA